MQLFREIQQLLANADDCDFELPAGDYALIETLVIRGRCRLRAVGAEKVTLTGQSPLFHVAEGGALELDGVHCVARAPSGPLISSTGHLLASRSSFSAVSRTSPAVSLAGGTSVFQNCLFAKNHFAGLEASADSKVQILDCRFEEHHSFAIRGTGSADIEIRDGSVVDGVGTGLCLTEKSQADVHGCKFIGNGAGVSWQDEARGSMRDSVCAAGGIGIEVRHRATVDIQDCDCSHNSFQGIVCQDDSSPRVRHNLCSHNGQEGIASAQRSRARIHHNHCVGNQTGIAVSHLSKSQVHHNHCGSNESFGIQVGDQAQAQVYDNTCAHNRSGVALFDRASGIVRKNLLEKNATGLQVCGTATTLVEGNLCESNLGWGLVVCDSARPRLEHNDLRLNPQPLRVGPQARPSQSGNLTTQWQRFSPSRYGPDMIRPTQAAGPRHGAPIAIDKTRVLEPGSSPCAPPTGLRGRTELGQDIRLCGRMVYVGGGMVDEP